MTAPVGETDIVQAIFSALQANQDLTTLLAQGPGGNTIRYGSDLSDGTTPVVVVEATADSPEAGVQEVHSILIDITASTRADPTGILDPADPMLHTTSIKRRIRETLIGSGGKAHGRLELPGGGCAIVSEDSEIPLRKDLRRDAEYWTTVQTFRVLYHR